MSYIDHHLLDNEKILYWAKPHWIIFLVPSFLSITAVLLVSQKSLLLLMGYIVLALFIISSINALLTYSTTEYALTNKRVVMKIGCIRRHSLEILLQRVESIQVNQSILGRLLGYGTIIICGTGGSKDPFHRIDNPLAFRKIIQEQLEKLLSNEPRRNNEQ